MARKKKTERQVCGIIMPISTMKVGELTYSEEYWKGVLAFLMDAISDAGFEPIVAWENNKSDSIHARIVQNIESHDVMIAVLVGNNPNVWLECGMRLWTQKPLLLLVSDKVGKIPFDVSPVNCLRFPEDCHYGKLKQLKKEMKDSLKRIIAPDYPSVLSHFSIIRPSDSSPAVKKEDLAKFMTETRNAIAKLQSQMETERSLYPTIPYGTQLYSPPSYSLSSLSSVSKTIKELQESFRSLGNIGRDVTNSLSCRGGIVDTVGPSGPTA